MTTEELLMVRRHLAYLHSPYAIVKDRLVAEQIAKEKDEVLFLIERELKLKTLNPVKENA